MFSENTLYYFFSTIAQVLAAVIALIAVLVHFRINSLKNFLIGDGKAVLNRKDRDPDGYESFSWVQKSRLSDAIDREDIQGIKDIIEQLKVTEINEGHTLKDRPRGFQWLFDHFISTESQIKEMSTYSKRAFISSFITALYSAVVILFIDLAMCSITIQITIVSICLISLSISTFYISKGISLAFHNFTNRFEEN